MPHKEHLSTAPSYSLHGAFEESIFSHRLMLDAGSSSTEFTDVVGADACYSEKLPTSWNIAPSSGIFTSPSFKDSLVR
jgi:hypothetical protein